MKLAFTSPPRAGAPVVVMISGLGGTGSYWLAQRDALAAQFQVVCYDQCGTGDNPATLPDNYQISDMANELLSALQQAGIDRFCVIGHALGALVGMQLALDYPQAVSALVLVNGWLSLDVHTRRCFQIRERLLLAGGPQAWVEAQPLFLYPADWLSAHAPRMEAEEALALAHEAAERGFGLMLGCMICTSRAIAAALPLVSGVRFADLDGPTWLAVDVEPSLRFSTGKLHLSASQQSSEVIAAR